MATLTNLLAVASAGGLPTTLAAADTLDLTGINFECNDLTVNGTTTGLSATAINDGTGDLTLDGSGNLSSTGLGTVAITGGDTTSYSMGANAAGDKTLSISATNAGAGDGLIDIDATGALTMDAGTFSIDSTGASNLSVTGGNLTVSTLTSGTLALTSVAALDLDGTAVTIDASTTLSIDALDTTNLSMAANDGGTKTLTVAASNSGAGEGHLSLSSDAQVDITDGALTLTLDGGALSEAGLTTLNLSGSGTAVVTGDGGGTFGDDTGTLVFDGTGGAQFTGVTTFDLQASGAVTIDSSAGAIGVGTDAVNQAINIGTGGTRTVTVGTSTTTLALEGGTGGVTITVDNATAAALKVTDGATDYITVATDAGTIDMGAHVALSAVDGSTTIIQSKLKAGETVATGDVVSLDYSVDGARVFVAEADDAETVRRNPVGVAIAGDTVGNEIPVAVAGVVSVPCTDAVAVGSALIGDFVYLSETGGEVTTTAPSTAGSRVYKMGILLSDNGNTANADVTILLQPQYMYDV